VLFWALRKTLAEAYTTPVHKSWVKIYSQLLSIIVPAAVSYECGLLDPEAPVGTSAQAAPKTAASSCPFSAELKAREEAAKANGTSENKASSQVPFDHAALAAAGGKCPFQSKAAQQAKGDDDNAENKDDTVTQPSTDVHNSEAHD
jgi:hypothetical protein